MRHGIGALALLGSLAIAYGCGGKDDNKSPSNLGGMGSNSGTGGNTLGGTGGTGGNTLGGMGVTGGTTLGGTGGTGGNTLGGMAGTGGNTLGGTAGTGGSDVPSPVVITSAEGAYWQTVNATESSEGDADVTVDASDEAQTWDGFGGCFTELGWVYLAGLDDAVRQQALELLFAEDGAHFTWGRIPIGGNDYVLSRYTLDDTGDDVVPDNSESNRPPADPELEHFSIDRDLEYLIPYIHAAQAVNPELRFWANPWTPPVWMKTGYTAASGSDSHAIASYYDGGNMKDDDETLSAHAQYFVRFLEAYADNGIDIEIVAPQNEPGYDSQLNYPSCHWAPETYVDFIGNYLGPALDNAGLDTRIMLGTFDADGSTVYINQVLANSVAREYCTVAGMGYGMVSASKVQAVHDADIPVWVSEHKAGNYFWLSSYQTPAPNDFAYAIETWELIRDAITQVGVRAYNAWHMVLDASGERQIAASQWAQDSLLVADGGELIITPAYYVFRHFSRYVEPGARVVTVSKGDAVAFRNPDGSLVVVLYNNGEATELTVDVSGRLLSFSAPAYGFVTLVVPNLS